MEHWLPDEAEHADTWLRGVLPHRSRRSSSKFHKLLRETQLAEVSAVLSGLRQGIVLEGLALPDCDCVCRAQSALEATPPLAGVVKVALCGALVLLNRRRLESGLRRPAVLRRRASDSAWHLVSKGGSAALDQLETLLAAAFPPDVGEICLDCLLATTGHDTLGLPAATALSDAASPTPTAAAASAAAVSGCIASVSRCLVFGWLLGFPATLWPCGLEDSLEEQPVLNVTVEASAGDASRATTIARFSLPLSPAAPGLADESDASGLRETLAGDGPAAVAAALGLPRESVPAWLRVRTERVLLERLVV